MSTTYYKATRPDGLDFYSGTVDYAGAVGGRVRNPSRETRASYQCCSGDVLHASDVPTETLIGGSWPCRLFEVTGRPVAQQDHKFGFRSLTVVREIEAWQALGPQGRDVAALIARCATLTLAEGRDLGAARGAVWGAAWDAAWDAVWGAARDAAWDAAWDAARGAVWGAAWDAARGAVWGAAWDAARDAARGAVLAVLTRDLISTERYTTLTGPWANVIGPAHPNDQTAVTR
jgi:hypothetical protein